MNDPALLTVYKASAGSGKTWRLTVEYLKLLLQNPDSYRKILAVTFTNKATTEMKERVLNALYKMMTIDLSAKPEDMLETICTELKVTPEFVRKQANTAMSFLLHDYGRFRIETIDSFFQSVLRNLARELGLGAYLNIELNNTEVLSDAVDSMVDKSDQNPELLKWMTDYIEELVQQGKSWKIDKALKGFGQTIFKEYFKEKEAILEAKLSDKNFLTKYKKELYELEAFSKKQIDGVAGKFFDTIQEQGLEVEDFTYGKAGVCAYFLKIKQGIYDAPLTDSKRAMACLENPESWSSAKNKRRNEITNLASQTLIPLLEETEQIRAKFYPDIISCQLAGAHLNKVGLLTDIAKEVKELNRENNRFLLSDTNALLKSLIQDSDASFVYEKTGTELNHILFDEFQDTSRMQWDTFRPLLAEGLANGYKSLIVGDEKQSIYRWRNGDWRILGNIRTEMRPTNVQEKILKNNWRSEQRIVEFNNVLFQRIEKRINEKHQEEFESQSEELKMAYRDVSQECLKKETKGLVEILFPYAKKSAEYQDLVLEQLVQKVEELQKQGIEPNQIAILIRKNKFIPQIGEYFANYKQTKGNRSYCYDIVSDEAFLLGSSKAVQAIIDALRLLNDPENPLAESLLKLDYQNDVILRKGDMNPIFEQTTKNKKTAFSAKTAYKKSYQDTNPESPLLPPEFTEAFYSLQRMPLYELVEALYQIFQLHRIPAQDSYLYAFMDGLSEYLQHNPSDIASFLNHWDEKMSQKSIPAGSGINGIRIMSIHKSKGLEFHTVLIPFCNWNLLSEVNTFQVWCQPETKPFNQLDLLPIDYGVKMNDSCFNQEYQEETLQLWVDSLNLLYVAFTRARHNLIVFCQGKDPEKTSEKLVTVSDLIQDILQDNVSNTQELNTAYTSASSDGETTTEARFQFGSLSLENPASADQTENKGLNRKGKDIALPFQSFIHKTRFKQSNRSVEFSKGRDADGFTNSFIDRGKLLHTLFSEINGKKDIPAAIQNLLNEGLITTQEAADYQLFVEKALSNPEVLDWYSEKHKLFNECSILSPDSEGRLKLKRPDRVMLSPLGVKVVDFKFGKPSGKYNKQVLEYMDLLDQMGYPNIKGYLWYVDDDRIEEVKK